MSKVRRFYAMLLLLVASLLLAACDTGGTASQPATTEQSTPAPAADAGKANTAPSATAAPYQSKLEHRGPMPEIKADTWLNGSPLTSADLRGHVVIVEFWTYLCSNCQHALPGLQAVYDKYKDSGLIVIGVHSPELAPERDISNIKQYIKEANIQWPVPFDPDFKVWGAFKNAYWPAFYIIDKQGEIRSVRVGEGNDAGLMSDVADLLKEQ